MAIPSENVRGAMFMVVAMAGFCVSDATMKFVAADLPLFQAIFLRGAFTTIFLGLLAWYEGVLFYRLSYSDRNILSIRVIGEVLGAICLLSALINMPIVNATAIVQMMPLMVILGAAFVFGEHVTRRSYLAISIGFVGVLLIVRPGSDGFTIHSIWAIGTVLFFTVRDLATRLLSSGLPSIFVAFVTSIAITIVSGMVSMTMPWQPVKLLEMKLLLGAAGFIFVGYLFSVMTMRVGDVGFVAPFRFSILIWALLWGMLIWALLWGMLMFAEFPDRWTMLGSAVIVTMGIYALSSSQRAVREPPTASDESRPGSVRL